ncbi:MAG: hypothetical protein JSV75_00090 [Candidatus Bathyarchaeota archaeon]|nr:MAG: hypothetical protein JSV75_00090 [Candidatus Bathyarchaeota archaeon]
MTLKNTVIFGAIGSLFAFLIICYPVVGSPISETVSVSTAPIDLLGGVECWLTCSFPVHLVPSRSTIDRGGSITYDIYIETPVNVKVSVFIPPPINEWYWNSLDFESIGHSLQIPITTGISANLTIEPSTQLTLEGPASLSKTSITFNEVGPPEKFTVSALSGASGGANIAVNADFHSDLHLGLSIDLPLFRQEIANIPIREIPMNPTVSDRITVSFSALDQLGAFIANPIILIGIFLFILILIFTIAMVIVAKRKRKTMETRKVLAQATELTKPKASTK